MVIFKNQLIIHFLYLYTTGEGTYQNSNCCPLVSVPSNVTTNITHKKYPSFVGLGVKKSGTSSLFFLLKNHPNFLVPSRKEITYFARDNSSLSIAEYLNNWNTTGYSHLENLHLFEISSNYLWVSIIFIFFFEKIYKCEKAPLSACRAKYFFPKMKFVVILRDQITRTWSHMNFEIKWCVMNNNSVDDCLEKRKHINYTEAILNGINKLKEKECDFNSGNYKKVIIILIINNNIGIPNKTWNDCYKCVTLLGPLIQHKLVNYIYKFLYFLN